MSYSLSLSFRRGITDVSILVVDETGNVKLEVCIEIQQCSYVTDESGEVPLSPDTQTESSTLLQGCAPQHGHSPANTLQMIS